MGDYKKQINNIVYLEKMLGLFEEAFVKNDIPLPGFHLSFHVHSIYVLFSLAKDVIPHDLKALDVVAAISVQLFASAGLVLSFLGV